MVGWTLSFSKVKHELMSEERDSRSLKYFISFTAAIPDQILKLVVINECNNILYGV